ncbi:C-4 methylsterol oxidase [Seminavis robusta]|uniref:C-4 methylsterol oxidase n=1 Tax=Seminavis robusta TaxID=568900 RepID=A0A9N8EEA8_9STRA|nr:C-4 methylsterol oxidase [Seminavis robusta]|eukprot:Sro951_g223820.1 C-4 methylsterol oxidase (162) ;mRNA; r:3854-4339
MAFTPGAVWRTMAPPNLNFWLIAKVSMFSSLFTEITFYAMHRIMHMKKSKNPIVKYLCKCHKIHHMVDSRQLKSHDAVRVHFVETIFNVIGILGGPLLMGCHPMVTLSSFTFTVANAFISHTDYFDFHNSNHILHHKRSDCNYGLTGMMDYIFGTGRTESK